MEARDGSAGFDFEGTYDEVKKNEVIAYTASDGRKARTIFIKKAERTHVQVTFAAENENPLDMQRSGWQAILDSFRDYTENLS